MKVATNSLKNLQAFDIKKSVFYKATSFFVLYTPFLVRSMNRCAILEKLLTNLL